MAVPFIEAWYPGEIPVSGLIKSLHVEVIVDTNSLADRDIFQDDQTESEDQDVRGHEPKRLVNPDLDSINRHPGVEVSEVQVHTRLVVVESGRHASL